MNYNEEWLDIQDYHGRYQVSNKGRIKTLCFSTGPRISKGSIAKIGYPMVTLSNGTIKTRKKHYIHRLVAAAFLGDCPPKYQVNHKDGVKTNNDLANLEYVTHKGNAQHALAIGLLQVGEQNHIAKLTEETVKEMRRLKNTMSYRRLAAAFGVTYGTCYSAISRRTWKHVSN